LVIWAMDKTALAGPLNVTAPEPVRNVEFARELGHVLGRPSFLPAPAFALRLALGELADTALLSSQRVHPAVAAAGGFAFRYPRVDEALRSIYGRRADPPT
jgi:NAD dependent epimerase/dehydratase family enzyme